MEKNIAAEMHLATIKTQATIIASLTARLSVIATMAENGEHGIAALAREAAAPALPEPAAVTITAFKAQHDKSWWISIKHPFGTTSHLCAQPRDMQLAELLAAQPLAEVSAAQAVPEGFALVPVKATAEMIQRGGHMNSEWLNDNAPLGECRYQMPIQSIWGAMLQVAGKPPSAQPTDTTREA